MPNTAAVTGKFLNTDSQPVAGGKVVATLVGTDVWDGGAQIVTTTESTTTDENGNWTLDLLVNGEGTYATTTWTVEGFDENVKPVFKYTGLFIPTDVDATMTALHQASAANIKAAKDNSLVRVVAALNYADYLAMPSGQRRDNDLVAVVPGITTGA